MEKLELRAFPFKVRGNGGANKIGGYAAVFNSPSTDLGFTEYIAPGAFQESLGDRSQDIVLAWAHDLSKPLASRNAGSLALQEDATGLAFKATLNGTTWARDAYEAIQSGAVSQVSFAFQVRDGGEQWRRENGKDVRVVTAARLFEVSPVVFAAYPATKVGVRTAADILASRPHPEPAGDDLAVIRERFFFMNDNP